MNPALCPNSACRCPVAAGDAFCPHCGTEIAAGVEMAAPAEFERQMKKLDNLEALLQPAPPADTVPTVPAAVPAALSDCTDLEVRYNNGCVFVNNMQSTFDLEIRPKVDGVRNLSVEIWQSGRLLLHETPMLMPRLGGVVPVSLNYIPFSSPGNVAFTIVVQYHRAGRRFRFAAVKKHTIYSGKEDPRTVCDKLVVEIKNNIQQGHAGDMKVDQDFRSLKQLVGQQNGLSLDKEFIDLINRHAFWSELVLQECTPDDKSHGAPRALPVRLQIKPDSGPETFWFHQTRLRAGRNRQCELLARHYQPDGREDAEASRLISQFHMWFEWQGGAAVVADLGLRPGDSRPRPSTAGVWIDGRRIPSGSTSPLQPGNEYTIALGETTTQQQAFAMKVRAWTLNELPRHGYAAFGDKPARQSPACIVIRPLLDSEKVFVLLNRALCLGWVDTRWGTACLCLDNGALRFCESTGGFWIEAGQDFVGAGSRFHLLDNSPQPTLNH